MTPQLPSVARVQAVDTRQDADSVGGSPALLGNQSRSSQHSPNVVSVSLSEA